MAAAFIRWRPFDPLANAARSTVRHLSPYLEVFHRTQVKPWPPMLEVFQQKLTRRFLPSPTISSFWECQACLQVDHLA